MQSGHAARLAECIDHGGGFGVSGWCAEAPDVLECLDHSYIHVPHACLVHLMFGSHVCM